MTQSRGQHDDSQWQPPSGTPPRVSSGQTVLYFLHWRGANGKRLAAPYDPEADRELAANDLAEKRTDHGDYVLTFDSREWRLWLTFRKRIGALSRCMWRKSGSQGASNTYCELPSLSQRRPRYLTANCSDGIAAASCDALFAVRTFELASAQPPTAGLIVHSDHGVQFDSAALGVKREAVYHCRCATRAKARTATFDYIEAFCNRTRLHSSLACVSPTTFESKLT